MPRSHAVSGQCQIGGASQSVPRIALGAAGACANALAASTHALTLNAAPGNLPFIRLSRHRADPRGLKLILPYRWQAG
jgi:hypothetical protein